MTQPALHRMPRARAPNDSMAAGPHYFKDARQPWLRPAAPWSGNPAWSRPPIQWQLANLGTPLVAPQLTPQALSQIATIQTVPLRPLDAVPIANVERQPQNKSNKCFKLKRLWNRQHVDELNPYLPEWARVALVEEELRNRRPRRRAMPAVRSPWAEVMIARERWISTLHPSQQRRARALIAMQNRQHLLNTPQLVPPVITLSPSPPPPTAVTASPTPPPPPPPSPARTPAPVKKLRPILPKPTIPTIVQTWDADLRGGITQLLDGTPDSVVQKRRGREGPVLERWTSDPSLKMKDRDWDELAFDRQSKAARHAQVAVDMHFQKQKAEDDDPSPHWRPWRARLPVERSDHKKVVQAPSLVKHRNSKKTRKGGRALAKIRKQKRVEPVIVVNRQKVMPKSQFLQFLAVTGEKRLEAKTVSHGENAQGDKDDEDEIGFGKLVIDESSDLSPQHP